MDKKSYGTLQSRPHYNTIHHACNENMAYNTNFIAHKRNNKNGRCTNQTWHIPRRFAITAPVLYVSLPNLKHHEQYKNWSQNI